MNNAQCSLALTSWSFSPRFVSFLMMIIDCFCVAGEFYCERFIMFEHFWCVLFFWCFLLCHFVLFLYGFACTRSHSLIWGLSGQSFDFQCQTNGGWLMQVMSNGFTKENSKRVFFPFHDGQNLHTMHTNTQWIRTMRAINAKATSKLVRMKNCLKKAAKNVKTKFASNPSFLLFLSFSGFPSEWAFVLRKLKRSNENPWKCYCH